MANEHNLLLTVEDAARRLAIGRSHLYELLRRGEIASIRLGRSRRVPVASLERFVEGQLEGQGDD